MRTPEQIYKRYKQFCSGVTPEEFMHAVRNIQDEAFAEGASFVQTQSYTEDEVRELFRARLKAFSTKREPFNALLLKQDMEWFEENKK